MKKLILFLVLLIGTICSAQTVHSTYLSILPTERGLGARYDITIRQFGIYTSFSSGDYYVSENTYIKDHYKITGGILLCIPKDSFDRPGNLYFTTGLNYHHYGEFSDPYNMLNKDILRPISFELGITFSIKQFALAVRTDILKWEPCLDVGINLWKQKQPTNAKEGNRQILNR